MNQAASAVWRGATTPIATALALIATPLLSAAQTNPVAQTLPYVQDFKALAHASSAYPAGWQGWTIGTAGPAFPTTGPTADQALIPLGSASQGTGGVYNYNGKIGPQNSGSQNFGLALAINTTGSSGVVVQYEVMTLRNPYNGTTNTRINEIALQYRVGNTGSWTTLTGSEYQNNTTTQVLNVVTPQNLEYRSVVLPAACDNQAEVQLRWAQRQASGAGARPSFAIDNVAIQQPASGGQSTALTFDGVDDYVTFGQALGLCATTFTIETWFRRTGPGVSTNTGAGGINVVPLVAKGFASNDGSTADMNYILGIRPFNGPVLAVDFEEGTSQTAPGQNHPLWGTTILAENVWYHAAATFDGTTLRIYLNGALEGTLDLGPGRLPQSASIQHATLGTALNSTGGVGTATQGQFQGVLDEARIWNVARSECEIAGDMNLELTGGTGLLGRWGMSEGAGVVLGNSLPTPNGILMNGPAWVAGSPFDAVAPSTPAAPTGLIATALDGDQIALSWTDVATTESGYAVERSTNGPGGPFAALATLGADATSYTDAPLSPTTEYCYRVRATGDCAPSAYSNVSCATTAAEGCIAGTSFTIEASAGVGGTITPSGGTVVVCGADQAFTIAPDACYTIADVLVDGASVGAVGFYTFTNVQANHTIAASFTLNGPFTIEASAGVGGTITPSGSTIVACGTDQGYTIAADPCYSIADVLVDGASIGPVASFTFTNTQSSHTISATFSLNGPFTIEASAGAGGTISPNGSNVVACGADLEFTIAPDPCHTIADVLVDGASVGAVTAYTFTNVQASHTIAVTFTQTTFTIEASAGAGGTITPSGSTIVGCGTDQAFTIAADACYTIADVVVDGISVGAMGFYTFTNVQADHTIAASFTLNGPFTIEASAGDGGTMTPSGTTIVACGGNQTYSITADPCGAIADVLVDGVSIGAVAAFTFSNVQGNHTISVTFTTTVSTIVAQAVGAGTITPSDSSVVACGDDVTYTITPDPGFIIVKVVVDNQGVGNDPTYTFTNVTQDHTITAIFGQTTAVADLPKEFALSRIWPNPVKNGTSIEFAVASAAHVRLSVLDVAGHEVHVLADGVFPPGRHSVAWDGRTARGQVAPGVYFVSYVQPQGRLVRKLVMTR